MFAHLIGVIHGFQNKDLQPNSRIA